MSEAELLQTTYYDKATIKRNVKVKDENGVTITTKQVIYNNIACAVSKKSLNGIIKDNIGGINNNFSMYCNPSCEIFAGDEIEVTSLGKTSLYIASKPFYYSSHAFINIEEAERT